MLSQETMAIVKSTAPLLREQGETLTRHFYARLFAHNPEVKPFFNAANQEGSQQRALAGAIAAYAENIDRLEALGGAVALITHKHAALQIKPEHYPIVGQNLLAAIKEVLGDVATDQVLAAWGEAYGFLAQIFIDAERKIYTDNASCHGGWEGFRRFVVREKIQESEIACSFHLAPEDGGDLPQFEAGQYITVRIPTPDGSTTMRNYSLSTAPNGKYFRITVKRESAPADANGAPAGYVSGYLHDSVAVGMVFDIAPPCGEFILQRQHAQADNDARPLVLIGGGIGITPILSMAQSATAYFPDRRIILIQAALNEKMQPFMPEIEQLRRQNAHVEVHYRYSQPVEKGVIRSGRASTGLVDEAFLQSFVPDRNADYYFCGPKAMMLALYRQLKQWSVPAAQIHFEFFGPRQELDAISNEVAPELHAA